MTDAPFATGGCQCGAVRYEVWAAPIRVEFCHCHSCRRAVANVFAAFADFRLDDFRWTRGKPSLYASSAEGRRGFCRMCGTPLSFASLGDQTIAITLGSLDEPGRFPAAGHCHLADKVSWLRLPEGPVAITESEAPPERGDGEERAQARLAPEGAADEPVVDATAEAVEAPAAEAESPPDEPAPAQAPPGAPAGP